MRFSIETAENNIVFSWEGSPSSIHIHFGRPKALLTFRLSCWSGVTVVPKPWRPLEKSSILYRRCSAWFSYTPWPLARGPSSCKTSVLQIYDQIHNPLAEFLGWKKALIPGLHCTFSFKIVKLWFYRQLWVNSNEIWYLSCHWPFWIQK